jgi:hypothetical protein
MAKSKAPKIDGLGPDNLKRIHSAVRKVWQWSKPWQLAKKRCVGSDGFPRCENPECPDRGKPVTKVTIDHVEPVGEVGGVNYIAKMFVPSSGLQGLCNCCHRTKTAIERKRNANNDPLSKKASYAAKKANKANRTGH